MLEQSDDRDHPDMPQAPEGRQTKMNDERFRLAKPFIECIIFEYNPYEKSLRRSLGDIDAFHVSDLTYNVPESLINSALFHPRSIEDARNIFYLLDDGEPFVESELALVTMTNKIAWIRFSCVNVFDDKGYLLKAIVIAQDITKQKEDAVKAERERRDLVEEINKDPLTGLFNRKYMTERIVGYLEKRHGRRGGIMFMIDTDEFHMINDQQGYWRGDEYLKRLADMLRGLFRHTDWLCRLGDDVFMAFVDDGNSEWAKKRAGEICRASKAVGVDFAEGNVPDDAFGVSVGIAIVGEDDIDFHELFRYADKALFAAKSKGRNDFAVYGEI